ncbi:hypothetical protein AGMMS49992_13280 [Clostridia bacterium]|nr:hypothetical protein AGMMS49992_13280 [Clostridia bacterium]
MGVEHHILRALTFGLRSARLQTIISKFYINRVTTKMNDSPRFNGVFILITMAVVVVALALFAFSEDAAVPIDAMRLDGFDGIAFTGYLQSGVPSGAGIIELDDGSAYYGTFTDGHMTGKGLYKAPDATLHEVTIDNGELYILE